MLFKRLRRLLYDWFLLNRTPLEVILRIPSSVRLCWSERRVESVNAFPKIVTEVLSTSTTTR